jgi:hypothetical protein
LQDYLNETIISLNALEGVYNRPVNFNNYQPKLNQPKISLTVNSKFIFSKIGNLSSPSYISIFCPGNTANKLSSSGFNNQPNSVP